MKASPPATHLGTIEFADQRVTAIGVSDEATEQVRSLRQDITACRACIGVLPHGPRPIVQLAANARILVISQAPGRLVHETGIAWNDASGARLREWAGLSPEMFYNPQHIALVPMGLCYPGKGDGADLPPRRECAPLWHDRILESLTKLRLTLLIGHYAQTRYLPQARQLSVTERVAALDTLQPGTICLPHPSWRSTGWMQRNPWFTQDIIPRLRERVSEALHSGG